MRSIWYLFFLCLGIFQLRTLWLFVAGLGKLSTVKYYPGWSAWKFLPLYLTDYLVNVLTGGAVESISRRAQTHRRGVIWDFILDVIEMIDPDHGKHAGPPLWGSKECNLYGQVILSVLFFLLLAGLLGEFVGYLFNLVF